eukprot:UN34278
MNEKGENDMGCETCECVENPCCDGLLCLNYPPLCLCGLNEVKVTGTNDMGCDTCQCVADPCCIGPFCFEKEACPPPALCLDGSTPEKIDVGSECCKHAECPVPCVCPLIYAPVCGVDGETYSNSCEAGCNEIEIASEGECEKVCLCPFIFAPVCGADGNTYDNSCIADCHEIEIESMGACPSCTDGILNQNEIGVDCGGVCDECIPVCACPYIMAPVCGTD